MPSEFLLKLTCVVISRNALLSKIIVVIFVCKELCSLPRDEFGVSHVNLFYNKDADVCFYLLDAPDKNLSKNIIQKPTSDMNGG
jgi:hypothetical protein